MDLKYAIREYKKARRYRKDAQALEDYYKAEILKQCQHNIEIAGIKIRWYWQSAAISASKLSEKGFNPDDYRSGGKKRVARITVDE